MARFKITIFPAALMMAAGVILPALSTSPAAEAAQHGVAAAKPGHQVWVQRYRGPASPANGAAGAVLSPDGTKVFVTGYSIGRGGSAFATIAYRVSTGARLWAARYPSGGKFFQGGAPAAISVSPDGSMVFVTGYRFGDRNNTDYATVAYRAATGKQVWAARYNGPAGLADSASSVAVSPHGNTVFVTGTSQGSRSAGDYATVAYRAATGAQLWVRRFNAQTNGGDHAAALAVSPNGQMIFVTGRTSNRGLGSDYLTVAYRAATGALRWHARYNGTGNGNDRASAVTVTPDSATVLVTGSSNGGPSAGSDWATIAYRAASGTQRWVSRYNGPASGDDRAAAMAIDPDGALVYVTGSSAGKASGRDCTTIAYRTTTGAPQWVQSFSGPGQASDQGNAVAISGDGTKLFVTGLGNTETGSNGDYLTIGYRAATGARLWVSRYNGPANSLDEATAVVVSPARVIVTGVSFRILGNPGISDFATIAYKS